MNQCFGCHYTKRALLSFAKKVIFTKKIDFPKLSYKNVQYFNLAQGHEPKRGLLFAITRSQFFYLAPFLSFFAALLLSLPFEFHILSGWCKKLSVNYNKAWK